MLNADAIVGQTGDLLGHNMFAYCKNNPINMADHNGYLPLFIIPAAAFLSSWAAAVITAPDFQSDLTMVQADLASGDILGAVVDTTALALPGVPGVGGIIDNLGKSAVKSFGELKYASDYGIDTYKSLRKQIKGTGLQAHHIIEKRLKGVLDIADHKLMDSVVVTVDEHKVFTKAWRTAVPYGLNYKSVFTKEYLYNVAKIIYKDYPAILDTIK